MTIDGRQVFVSPKPFVSLADVESIEQADEAISIRVGDQAAERLSAAAKSPVAVFVGNELVGVVPATVSGGVISLASGTIPPSALGRFGSGATVGRAVSPFGRAVACADAGSIRRGYIRSRVFVVRKLLR
jgi:hypothetical protein